MIAPAGLHMRPAALLRRGEGALVFACFAAAYVLSYAFRSINAIIAPDLVADMHLSNGDLGLLSSAYFLTFAAMQLPVGIWLDRRGARRVEALLLLIGAAGAVIFATATSAKALWLGRALIGAGVSACLMAAYAGYRRWYPSARQSQLSVWMLVAGSGGALSTTLPVQAVLPWLGWRGVFWAMAAMLVAAAAALYFGLARVERREDRLRRPAAPDAASAAPSSRQDTAAAYALLLRHPAFQRVLPFGLFNQASFMAVQTLWAGPWMTDVLGFGLDATARILFAFNIALLAGYLLLGWLAPRHARNSADAARLVTIGAGMVLALQVVIVLWTAPAAWMLWPLLALFASTLSLILSTLSLSFPAAIAGRANTSYNLAVFGGGFLLQWGLGVAIDAFRSTGLPQADAFRAALGCLLVLQCAGYAWFIFAPRRGAAAR